jgi:hypothetical protein
MELLFIRTLLGPISWFSVVKIEVFLHSFVPLGLGKALFLGLKRLLLAFMLRSVQVYFLRV